jgi:outer membrane biosynthesis protein TonB
VNKPHAVASGERRVPEFRPARPTAVAAGGPSEAMIGSVVKKRENQAALKVCYERALKRDDRLRSGRIDVTAELGSSGTVTSVSLTAPPEFVTVEACIKTAVRRWAFPVAPHGYRAEFPLILQGNL